MQIKSAKMVSVLSLAICMVGVSPVWAETLQEAVDTVLGKHERIKAAESDLAAGEAKVSETFANNWLPLLNVTTNIGHERQMNKPAGVSRDPTGLGSAARSDSDMDPRETDFKLTQRLFDWGKANSDIRVAKMTRQQYAETLEVTRQALVLEAVTAFYNLKKSNLVLDYSLQSEENVLKQTEVENVRVALGQGYSTDVLMAKSQLSQAQARRVVVEGGAIQAENRASNVFRRPAKEVDALVGPRGLPIKQIPANLAAAVEQAVRNNPQLHVMSTLVELNKNMVDSVSRGLFGPLFNLVGEQKYKNDVGGTAGYQRETLGKLEVTFALNTGLSALDSIKAAKQSQNAAEQRYADTRITVEEQVRNAWQNLDTARKNAFLLEQTANLTAKFLDQAREERKMGKRTLLDLLSSETGWINAQSDAAAARTDIVVAFYTLLQTMGDLKTDMLQGQKAGGKVEEGLSGAEDLAPKVKKANSKASDKPAAEEKK